MMGTAIKRGLASPEEEAELAAHCSRLNTVGEALGKIAGVHAMTDVTGFGFYGHLLEMCKGAGLSAEVNFSAIPLIEAAKPYAAKFVLPDNTFRNSNAVKDFVQTTVKEAFAFLNDPQTNGGLLLSADPEALPEIREVLHQYGLQDFSAPVGKMERGENSPLIRVL
jgi:selenide,water dikinase